MITNCPNCGAPLDKAGYCSYCKTNVVPNLDIFKGDTFGYGSLLELNLNVIDPWGNSMTIPLKGHIDNIEFRMTPCEATSITFTFEGEIIEMKEG